MTTFARLWLGLPEVNSEEHLLCQIKTWPTVELLTVSTHPFIFDPPALPLSRREGVSHYVGDAAWLATGWDWEAAGEQWAVQIY